LPEAYSAVVTQPYRLPGLYFARPREV